MFKYAFMALILSVSRSQCAEIDAPSPPAVSKADAPSPPAIPKGCLTQVQIQRLIQAEQAKAIAAYVAQEKENEAKDVYEALQSAFSAKSQAPAVQPK